VLFVANPRGAEMIGGAPLQERRQREQAFADYCPGTAALRDIICCRGQLSGRNQACLIKMPRAVFRTTRAAIRFVARRKSMA